MKVLIAYYSFSGNTEEIAEMIQKRLELHACATELYEIGRGSYFPEVRDYDVFVLGTFTWDLGAVPAEVKDFVADVGYKPERVAVFGSGDTQFGGDELFCMAVTKLAAFYHSPWPELKIEQSARGSQEGMVYKWTDKVVASRRKEKING
jgi:predicted ribonucleotide reductase-associated flavodoxin